MSAIRRLRLELRDARKAGNREAEEELRQRIARHVEAEKAAMREAADAMPRDREKGKPLRIGCPDPAASPAPVRSRRFQPHHCPALIPDPHWCGPD
jgi:hypothetical protein